MDQLHFAAQEAVGAAEPRLTSAVITTPDLFALYDEDLYDAAEFLQLDADQIDRPWPFKASLQSDWRYRRQPKHLFAAFAGYGFGMCVHYTSTRLCEEEENTMSPVPVVAISFTQQGLQLEHNFIGYSPGLTTAHTEMLMWQQHPSWYSSDLGFSKYPKDSYSDTDRELYWTRVRHQLNEWLVEVLSTRYYMNVTDVLLLGESAVRNERFREEVMKAVMERDEQLAEPSIHGGGDGEDLDPLFVASRGAAEISRRIWEAPFWYCGFPGQCRE